MNAPKTVSTGLESTKLIIVQTALSLFSQFGIEGVSLSKLREQAGQQNRSAIHYHFDNKEGLLIAVTAHVSDLIAAEMGDTFAMLERDSADRYQTLEALLTVLYTPLLNFYFSGDTGKSCVRYISHMAHEMENARRDMAFQPLKPLLDKAYAVTSRFFPNSSPQDHAVRLYLGTATLMEMLVCSDMLVQKHEIGGHEMSVQMNPRFRSQILTYMAAGMSSV